jgi:Spy/CpxP family protein refolding chaperone
MKKERLMWAAIVGLLILNLFTIGFVVTERMGPPGHGGPWRYVSNTLELTPHQQDLYIQMRDRHRGEMRRLTGEYRKLLYPYLTLLGEATPDPERKAALEAQLAGIERIKVQVTFAHFQELRSVCTPEQQQRFPEMIPRLADVLCGPVPHREPGPTPGR